MIDVLEQHESDALSAEQREHEYLNDLLSNWHGWASGQGYGMGYPKTNATCRMVRASRQYDDANGGLDAHIDAVLMEGVDAVVSEIPQPWNAALHIQARNLHTGCQVWSSPRLPACPRLRGELLQVARRKFAEGLARAELI